MELSRGNESSQWETEREGERGREREREREREVNSKTYFLAFVYISEVVCSA